MTLMSRVASILLPVVILDGCGQGGKLATPPGTAAIDSGIGADGGSIDQRRVDCTGSCAFAATYTVATDGFFAQHRDRAVLSPPLEYRHRYGIPSADGGPNLECAPALPTCSDQGPVSACSISQDLADPDVQQALAQATAPFFGCDCRSGDANVFSFMRDDGHGFLVGSPDTTSLSCPLSGCRVTIPVIPSGIARLMADLYSLDAAVILSAECLNLNVRLLVAGSTSSGSG